MSEFVKTFLDQVLLEPISGSRPKGGVNTEGDIPSLGGENVTMTGSLKFYPVKKISSNFYNSMSRGHLRNLDVLINKDGANTGKSSIYRNSPYKSAAVNEHLFILRGKEGVLEQEYLHYLLQLPSVRAIIDKKITGSAQPGLNTTFIHNFPIELAPLSEQKKIVSILTSMDEVIENTQKQIDKLQDLKKATMNELLTNGIGHKEFKDSELGRIPKSWEVKKLQELTSGKFGIVDGPFGSNLKTEHYRSSGVPVIQSGFVTSGKFIAKNYIYVDYSKFKAEIRSAVNGGDIVMAKIGAQAGKCAIMPKMHPVGILAGNSLKISPNENVLNINYLNNLLTHLYVTGEIQNLRTETAQPAISIATLKQYKIRVPNVLEQKKITDTIDSIEAGIERRFQKLSRIQALKKSLMQDLLTGKVRVKAN